MRSRKNERAERVSLRVGEPGKKESEVREQKARWVFG